MLHEENWPQCNCNLTRWQLCIRSTSCHSASNCLVHTFWYDEDARKFMKIVLIVTVEGRLQMIDRDVRLRARINFWEQAVVEAHCGNIQPRDGYTKPHQAEWNATPKTTCLRPILISFVLHLVSRTCGQRSTRNANVCMSMSPISHPDGMGFKWSSFQWRDLPLISHCAQDSWSTKHLYV